jgi:aminobutyraldehyde dehydrogenase
VAGFVERASGTGHREITVGSKARAGAGFFYEPTVIAGARQDDEIVERDVFRPVVSVTRFTDTEQAISWMGVSKMAGTGRSQSEVGRQDATFCGC